MMKSARGEMDLVTSLQIGAYAASANGAGVSKVGFYGVLAILSVGAVTDGTHAFKLQDSDDNITFTDVAAKNLNGTFTNVTSANSNSVQRVGYLGQKKYVRIVTTVTGATTGGLYMGAFIRCFPGVKPVP